MHYGSNKSLISMVSIYKVIMHTHVCMFDFSLI